MNDSGMAAADLIEREFDMLAQRAGLEIPAQRRAAVLAAFRDFRPMLARLHGERPAQNETAHVFSIEHVRRGAHGPA